MALIDLLHVGTDTMLFVSLSNSNALKKDGGKGFQPMDDAFWVVIKPKTNFTTSVTQNSPFGDIGIDVNSVRSPPSQYDAAVVTMMNQALDLSQLVFLSHHSEMDKNYRYIRTKGEKSMDVEQDKQAIIRFRERKLIPMNLTYCVSNQRLASSAPWAKGIYAFTNVK